MEPATGSLSAVSLQQMPSTVSSQLMDKVPAELRLKIFRLVLQANTECIKPVRQGTRPGVLRLDTALFAVSRQVSQEAQHAFFELHAVIITDLDAGHSSIPLFRRIEFRPRAALPLWPTRVLRACSPKLKNIVLARENLGHSTTLHKYLERHKPGIGSRLRCLELGLFEIKPDEGIERRVFVKDFQLHELLPAAKKTMAERTLHELYTPILATAVVRGMDAPEEFQKVPPLQSLAWCLAAYDKFRVLQARQCLAPGENSLVDEWRRNCLFETPGIKRAHEQLPDGVNLADLNVVEHGHEVVEWATELVGLNLREMEQSFRRRQD